MYKTTKGLVLREVKYRDSSRILTVLTETDGKLTVSAKGARRKGSRIAAASQLLVYSEFTLFGTSGRWHLNEGNTIEIFEGLRNDVVKLSLGEYFAELLEAVTDEDSPNIDVLRLGLNSLYTLSGGRKPEFLVKASFELRLMCLAGYEPMLDSCAYCGSAEPEEPLFDTFGGALMCRKCAGGNSRKGIELYPASLAAMRHITGSEDGKLFSFTINREALNKLSDTTEKYVEAQLERRFKTLDFYKEISGMI